MRRSLKFLLWSSILAASLTGCSLAAKQSSDSGLQIVHGDGIYILNHRSGWYKFREGKANYYAESTEYVVSIGPQYNSVNDVSQLRSFPSLSDFKVVGDRIEINKVFLSCGSHPLQDSDLASLPPFQTKSTEKLGYAPEITISFLKENFDEWIRQHLVSRPEDPALCMKSADVSVEKQTLLVDCTNVTPLGRYFGCEENSEILDVADDGLSLKPRKHPEFVYFYEKDK